MESLQRLCSQFVPTFQSEDAYIKIDHFLGSDRNPEILKLRFSSECNFYEHFMELFFDDIDLGLGRKYIDKALSQAEIKVIKDTIHDTEFALHRNDLNIYGIIAETLLKSYRVATTMSRYLSSTELVSTPTHSGPDLVELIEESGDFFMILWDSRNNLQERTLTSAIQEKIRKLANTDWFPTLKKVESLKLGDFRDIVSDKVRKGELNYQKTMAFISGDDNITEFPWDRSIVNVAITQLTSSMDKESKKTKKNHSKILSIKNRLEIWKAIQAKNDYDYFYLLIIVPNYSTVCRRIFNDLKCFPICSE